MYPKVGSLLPISNEPHRFLQIFSVGGEDLERALVNRVDARCGYDNLNSPYVRCILNLLFIFV